MYRKYKPINCAVPKFLECSKCFGHPLFASENSFLVHQQECHGDAFKMAASVTDNDFLSTKHQQSIDMLSEKVRSQDDSIYEVKEQLQFLIGDIHNHRDYNTEEINQQPVIGLRRRPSKISVLNDNSIRLKEEELKITEELRLLNIQQQKQNEHQKNEIQEQQLKDIITNNFNFIFKQFNTLESKIDSKICVDQNTKQQVDLLLQQKDEQIQVFKDENILLSRKHAHLKATITILRNELKENHPKTPVSTESLEELSYKAKKLKTVNEIWMHGANCKIKDLAQQKSLVKHLKDLLGEKEKLLDRLQTKYDKNDERMKSLVSENSSLKEQVIMLGKDVKEKENRLIISLANIKTCKDEAEIAEKQLLEGCIEQLKQQYNVDNKLKENKITEISAKLCNIEKSYSKANDIIAQLQKEKAEMLLNLDERELLYQKEKERYEIIVKDVEVKYDKEKRALIEKTKHQYEKKAKERFTDLQEELALKINTITSKDRELKILKDTCEIVNEELYQMKCTLQSSANDLSNLKIKATEYSELLKQEKKISEKLKEELKEQQKDSKTREKQLVDEKEDIEFKVNELEVALEEVTESRDLLEFEKDETVEKNKLQRKSLNSFIDNCSRQHNKMNNLINENNYFYERYSTHMTFRKHADFNRNETNEKLKASNTENERITRENNDLRTELQSCMKELNEVKLLTMNNSNSYNDDEKITSKTNLKRADEIQIKTKLNSQVSNDINIDDFIADLDDILHSEEKPALLQHSCNEATDKNNDQLTEDITVSDFRLSQCDYYEDAKQAEIAPSTSNDVSFEFEEKLEDLPQDNVKVIDGACVITDLHTDWDAITEEKSTKQKQEILFTAADDDMLKESASNFSSRDELAEPVDTTNNILAEPADNSVHSPNSIKSVTEHNYSDKGITVSHISSRDYAYGELAEPVANITDTTNSKIAEPADNLVNSPDSFKSITEDNYSDKSITVSHISSRDYNYGELAEPVDNITDTTNSKLADPADSSVHSPNSIKSVTEDNYSDKSITVSHISSRDYNFGELAEPADSSVHSPDSIKPAIEENNSDESIKVSHISSRDYEYGELAEPVVNITDITNSKLVEPADKSLTEENYLDESFDAPDEDVSVASSGHLINDNDADNSEVMASNDIVHDDYLNDNEDDYLNESFEEEEESRDQSVSDVASANDSQTKSRDDDSSKVNFHAINLSDEEEVCDESCEEEICEEIDDTSDDIYANGADSLSNENQRNKMKEITLDSTMVVKKSNSFFGDLPSLSQSPSVLMSARNDVTTDEDDISFGNVNIDDLLTENQKQPNKYFF